MKSRAFPVDAPKSFGCKRCGEEFCCKSFLINGTVRSQLLNRMRVLVEAAVRLQHYISRDFFNI